MIWHKSAADIPTLDIECNNIIIYKYNSVSHCKADVLLISCVNSICLQKRVRKFLVHGQQY